jgi:transposase
MLKCPNKNFIRRAALERLFVMTQKELSIYALMLKVENRSLSQMKASELLNISDRHFRRLVKTYRKEGAPGLISKKRGKPSNNRLPEKLHQKIIEIIKKEYLDFGPTLAREKLLKYHKIKVSVETLRQWMLKAEIWHEKRRKKLTLHQSRLRRSNEGELIQVDGSPHDWFEGRGGKCSLLGFIDDATSKIKHLKFVGSESTASYFHAFIEYLIKHGRPKSFYTDRLNVFKVNNDKEGYRKSGLTQVGRALKELGIELICANSPQAKGRIERLFATLQDRLVKELRLKNICSIDEANAYLPVYIQEHNAQFSVEAKESSDLHERISGERIIQAFVYKEERRLTKNLELSYCNRILQIQTDRPTYAMRRAKVLVMEDLQGKIEIEYEGKKLKYKELLVKDSQGRVINKKEAAGRVFPPRGKGAVSNF